MTNSNDLVQLELDKQHMKQSYNRVCSVVNQAAEDYRRCKNHNVVRRYGEVRDMIKRCTADDVLQDYSDSFSRDTEQPSSSGNLSVAVRNLAETTSKLQNHERIKSEIRNMSKKDRKRQIEKTATELSDIKQKFEQVNRKLTTLKRDYDTSKRRMIVRRYRDYKCMMKNLIQDDNFY